ncbi:MAG: PKD domain-containing protein [Bacteroidales bacterium]|nr:PKD domain-containing protein [Bacteroidales bacterium]
MKKWCLGIVVLHFTFFYAQNWVMQNSNFGVLGRGIMWMYAVDSNIVWALGYDGTNPQALIQEFTRTSNGGSTWKAGSIPNLANHGPSCIVAVDSLIAWVAFYNANGGGKILKTSDGGLTWTHQNSATFSAPNGFPNIVYFWDHQKGVCIGDPNGGYFEIYTTNDGGNTWTRVPDENIPRPLNNEYGVTSYYSVVGNTIYFSTNQSRIFKSTDFGHTWTVLSTPIPANKQFKVVFRSLNDGIIRMNETPYTAYITHDGGQSWQLLSFNGKWYRNDFTYVKGTTNTWVSVGADYQTPYMGISYSTDDGLNWIDFPNMDTTQHLQVVFPSHRVGYVGAFHNYGNDGIFKYTGQLFVQDTCSGFTAEIIPSATLIDLAQNSNVSFSVNATGSIDSYLWNFGDGNTSTDAQPVHSFSDTGTYVVSVIVQHGNCKDTAFIQITVLNSTSMSEVYSSFNLWPNPVSDQLHISSPFIIDQVVIRSLDGRTIMIYEKPTNVIDVSLLRNGSYMVEIVTAQLRIHKSLLK